MTTAGIAAMPLFDLRGRVALVTGACGGLGAAIVDAYAAHGATLLLSDRDAAATEAAAQALRDQGHDAQALPCNLAQPGAAAASAEAALTLTARLLPAMAEHGGGSVILMASIAALRGNKAIGPYGISKAALAQLARNLAVEWGPRNVCVNAIAPGLVRSPLSAGLMADDAFITGQTLVVDGGTLINDGN